MYSVTNEYRAAINKPDRVLKSRITLGALVLDDTNIQGFNLNGGIVAGNDFEIGTSIMSLIDIELIDLDYTLSAVNFEDKELKVEIAIQLEDNSFEYVPLGLFTVESCEKSDRKIKLSGCDRMYKFEKDYISTLTYPVTLLNIAKEICSLAGVELLNTSFPNSNVVVNSMPVLDKVTLRKAISQIAELAGGYCRITRDGKLEIFNLTVNSNSVRNYVTADGFTMGDYDPIADELIAGVIEVNRANYISLTNKDLTFATVDKVIVKLGAEEATKGFGENPYYIVDNIFCQNPNLFIDNLYSALNGLSYMPFNSKWQGNMAIDCGDMISINTGRGIFNTIATNKKLTYRGGLREDYVAVAKSNTEKSSTTKGSLTLDMEKAKTEIKVLDGKIEQRVTKEEYETYVEQTAETIKNKVSKGEDLKTEVTQNAESWKLSIDGKLKGTTYEFTGEGFKLGDTTSGDVAEHTNTYSKYNHQDGTSTEISPQGLLHVDGSTKKEYHYLNYTEFKILTISTSNEVYIDFALPSEFKNKNFKVDPILSELAPKSFPSALAGWNLAIDSINYVDATVRLYFSVTGYSYKYNSTLDGFIIDYGPGSGYISYDARVGISITA